MTEINKNFTEIMNVLSRLACCARIEHVNYLQYFKE